MFEYTDYKRAVPRLAVGVEAQIERINQGEILADIIEREELDHFYALIALNGIVARNQETGEETEGGGQVTVYVLNLIDGLEEVSALFYGKESEQWEVIPAEGTDSHKKTVTMVLPGSGILTVIYKR